MAYTTIKNRLKRARANTHAGEDLGRIAELLHQGAYYDELTDEEREAYKAYKESLGGVADDIAGAELEIMFFDKTKEEAYHFPLTKRKRPPTKEELAQRVQEVEDIVNGYIEEYNTPEAKAEREREYLEMTQKGREV